jgi:hypothetical protein
MLLLTSHLINVVYVGVFYINNIASLVCFISLIIGYLVEGLLLFDEGKGKIFEKLLIAVVVSFVSGVEIFLENDEIVTMLGILLMITGYFVEIVERRRCKKITKIIILVVYSLSVPIIIALLSFLYDDIEAIITSLVMLLATLICCLVEIFWHGDGKYYKEFGFHSLFSVFTKKLLFRKEII